MFLELLSLTKMKGNRNVLRFGVSGICEVVQENEMAREGVTILLDYV